MEKLVSTLATEVHKAVLEYPCWTWSYRVWPKNESGVYQVEIYTYSLGVCKKAPMYLLGNAESDVELIRDAIRNLQKAMQIVEAFKGDK